MNIAQSVKLLKEYDITRNPVTREYTHAFLQVISSSNVASHMRKSNGRCLIDGALFTVTPTKDFFFADDLFAVGTPPDKRHPIRHLIVTHKPDEGQYTKYNPRFMTNINIHRDHVSLEFAFTFHASSIDDNTSISNWKRSSYECDLKIDNMTYDMLTEEVCAERYTSVDAFNSIRHIYHSVNLHLLIGVIENALRSQGQYDE